MPKKRTVDVVILGSGPAGLQAAIHAARKKAATLMLGRLKESSLYWAHVENYCCMFKVSGEEILRTGRAQAQGFGAEILDQDVLNVSPAAGGRFDLALEDGEIITAKSLVIATGTARNKLGVPGEKELLGRGVSYCVECDAGFHKGGRVAVVGDGSAAAGGALFLTRFAATVHLVCNDLEVSGALEKKIQDSAVILHRKAKVLEIVGPDRVEALVLDNGPRLEVSGVFIELGAKGVLELAAGLGVALDQDMKYIVTDKRQATNVPGVFAAGDVCGPPLQMAKAVGEGCVAGIEAAARAKAL
ncbi:MAG: FAD-dependent oxidoreductase [Desulfovibrionaceae bacterium]|nr:FAD-dependent oxidoreductase [Desulfovibrionaceae bacterium]